MKKTLVTMAAVMVMAAGAVLAAGDWLGSVYGTVGGASPATLTWTNTGDKVTLAGLSVTGAALTNGSVLVVNAAGNVTNRLPYAMNVDTLYLTATPGSIPLDNGGKLIVSCLMSSAHTNAYAIHLSVK